jgi:GT2 family glycosyltransferase/glycosyltransferase involved in cell wall biosynthesis
VSKKKEDVSAERVPTTLSASALEAESDAVRLARLTAAQRRTVAKLRQRSAPAEEVEAAEGILEVVAGALARTTDLAMGRMDPLDLADALARNERFQVPPSHRKWVGPVVRLGKRAAVEGLQPFHLELLRPQSRFNVEAVQVARRVRIAHKGSEAPDLADWVHERLDGLADTTKWKIPSHRKGWNRFIAAGLKTSYLRGLGPLLRRVLRDQVRFNQRVVDVLVQAADGTRSTSVISNVHELQRLVEWPTRMTLPWPWSGTVPVWREVFRRQESFNRALVQALQDLVGVYGRPAAGLGVDYRRWTRAVERRRTTELDRLIAKLPQKPLISLLVPIYQTRPDHLEACLASVEDQTYPHWELCVVDDGSRSSEPLRIAQRFARRFPGQVRIERLGQNSGIAVATNSALAMASGEFVGFLDHDDTLAPTALAEVAMAVQAEPDTDVLYSDEDKLDFEGGRCEPFFKPDWSPDLLRSVNYVCHFLVMRRSLAVELGGARQGFEGAQDYDFVLRATERARGIKHIAQVLYHWRKSETSTAAAVENKPHASSAGQQAVQQHLDRLGEAGTVEETEPTNFRIRYPIPSEPPLVSMIVPFKDKPELLGTLIESLERVTQYTNYELLLVSNNSSDPRTFSYLATLRSHPKVRLLEWNHPFNWSAINNFAAQHARGSLLLFLNNDIEVIDSEWLDELVSQASRSEIAIVGPQLLYPDRTIQSAGVVVGLGGFAGHPWAGLDPEQWTAFGRCSWYRDFLAVTGACLMVRRDVFDRLGGFDERFTVCGSDVELGLRAVGAGQRVLYTPFSRVVHHESATRDPQKFPESDSWLSFEVYRPWLEAGDPFYNPHLSLEVADGRLRTDTRTPAEIAAGALAQLQSTSAQPTEQLRHRRTVMGFVNELDTDRPGVHSPPISLRTGPARLERLSWLVPYFKHPYGGIHTILRFGQLLRERHGVESEFVVFDRPEITVRELETRIRPLYPEMPGRFSVLRNLDEIEEQKPTDAVIGTFWTSAYLALRHPRARIRAYFVQDFEPLFYPAGTLYALAEHTYRLGLFGIFNSPGLGEFVRETYSMEGVSFEPAVDTSLFHANRPARSGAIRVFFYGRPSADRNGFELGVTALRRLKEEVGDRVEIISAGETWAPEDYDLRGVVRNLGVLPYEHTAELYRTCDVGLVFMFTKHPSYLPLELMASGVCVVTNDNPANRWLLRHEENCLVAMPVASAVLRELKRAVQSNELRVSVARAAVTRMRTGSWERAVDVVYDALSRRLTTSQGRVPVSTAASG